MGKKVGLALRAANLQVVLHLDILPDDSPDEDYLSLCVENDWVVITADSDVHNKENQRRAIKNGNLRVFRLTRNHWQWDEKVKAFISAIPAMKELLRGGRRPFIARIDKAGRIATIEDFSAGESDGVDPDKSGGVP